MGITDTAMLRPQVFAFCDGEVQVGLIGSEKQAIDATLLSLSKDDNRICPVADRYWNARGGSHNDGGAFIFNLQKNPAGKIRITCTDKFGKPVPLPGGTESCDFSKEQTSVAGPGEKLSAVINEKLAAGNSMAAFEWVRGQLSQWTFDEFRAVCREIAGQAKDPAKTATAIEVLTLLNDRRYSTGAKRRSHLLQVVHTELNRLFGSLPNIGAKDSKGAYRLIDFATRGNLRAPLEGEKTLVIDAANFAPEGSQLRRGVARGRLHERLAAVHQLQLHRPALHRLRPRPGNRRCGH